MVGGDGAETLPALVGLLGKGGGVASAAVLAVYILNKLWESVKSDRRDNTTADTVASASRDLIDGMREELMSLRERVRVQDEMIEELRRDKLELTIKSVTLQNNETRRTQHESPPDPA